MTSHPRPLVRQPISCYYYVRDLSYFDVVFCPSSSQILAISFSRKPKPPKCSLASLTQVPKVNSKSSSKNPRSANGSSPSVNTSNLPHTCSYLEHRQIYGGHAPPLPELGPNKFQERPCGAPLEYKKTNYRSGLCLGPRWGSLQTP